MTNKTTPTAQPPQRAFLVGIEFKHEPGLLSLEDSLTELALLADTAGLEVVGETYQKLDSPNPNSLVGKGKVAEIRDLVEETLAEVVIFDEELSPRHTRELQEVLGDEVQLIDRTGLILDIFAQHAHTREGALQVELAQYEYRLPRLTRAWTHLARQAGGGAGRGGTGGVGLRGPGETQLEVDRREISRKITHLKRELEKVRAHRGRHRARRKKGALPVVSIVGYTNAGKSTLLNRLAGADVFVADQLFATLDPTTRKVKLPGGRVVLFTDTVGFIQKLPAQLIAAFRATLEEITEADLLLHIVDITHANAVQQAEAVAQTLKEIKVNGHVPMVTALNKIDALSGNSGLRGLPPSFQETTPAPDAGHGPRSRAEWGAGVVPEAEWSGRGQGGEVIPISALRGLGMQDLLASIEERLYDRLVPVHAQIPYQAGRLISIFHEHGVVEVTEHVEGGVVMRGRIPARLETQFVPYLIE